jgi:hypothetical protein
MGALLTSPTRILQVPSHRSTLSSTPKPPFHVYQVQRPIPDERACARPEPWPNLPIVIKDSDTCTRASVLLEGEQKIRLTLCRDRAICNPFATRTFLVSPSILALLPL